MTLDAIREYCLSKAGVEESLPFGPDALVLKTAGRIFLIIGLDSEPLRFSAKADPDKVIEMREQFPSVQPGYHLNKKHWNTIIVDGSVSSAVLKSWIDHSYELVAEKKPSRSRKKS